MEEKDPKGFTVKDRRKVSIDDLDRKTAEQPAEQKPEERQGSPEHKAQSGCEEPAHQRPSGTAAPLPEVAFATFVLSLSSSALVHLGEIADPVSQRTETDLPMAKQVIDTLGMLQEKTKGNLDAEEERLVKTLLYDLRLRYVQKCGK